MSTPCHSSNPLLVRSPAMVEVQRQRRTFMTCNSFSPFCTNSCIFLGSVSC